MAGNNKPPNQIVEKPDVGNRDIETVAAHVRAMLMRLIAKRCAASWQEKHRTFVSEGASHHGL
jgi:hypothetical protein